MPRKEGNGWAIQKTHELLHVAIDVKNFGSPKNFDTGIMENRLIHVGKINALTTQKRGPTIFTRQLASRIHEKQCFDKAWRCNKHLLNTHDNESIHSTNTFPTDSVSTVSSGGIFITTMKEKFSLRKQPDCIVRK